jgi:hypothetical protein
MRYFGIGQLEPIKVLWVRVLAFTHDEPTYEVETMRGQGRMRGSDGLPSRIERLTHIVMARPLRIELKVPKVGQARAAGFSNRRSSGCCSQPGNFYAQSGRSLYGRDGARQDRSDAAVGGQPVLRGQTPVIER